eukprot:maker-scaffold_9-snap-gene-1.31-mRNA-1 protein AED:0.00 eAED:0.00 QI:117/1/1/1/1/1/2/1635/169
MKQLARILLSLMILFIGGNTSQRQFDFSSFSSEAETFLSSEESLSDLLNTAIPPNYLTKLTAISSSVRLIKAFLPRGENTCSQSILQTVGNLGKYNETAIWKQLVEDICLIELSCVNVLATQSIQRIKDNGKEGLVLAFGESELKTIDFVDSLPQIFEYVCSSFPYLEL